MGSTANQLLPKELMLAKALVGRVTACSVKALNYQIGGDRPLTSTMMKLGHFRAWEGLAGATPGICSAELISSTLTSINIVG